MKINKDVLVLYTSMFVMGACGIAYEYTFSKVASDLLGNSSRQWAIIIGLMMFFMGVGSDIQKYVSDKNLFDKFITVEVILGIFGGFGPVIFLFTFGTYPSHYVLVQYFFIIMVGLLIGFEIPILVRINEKYISELKVNIGGVLKMDYIGSFFGAFLWIMILPKFFTIIECAFVLSFFNIFIALVTLIYFKKMVFHKRKVALFIFLSLSLTVLSGFNSKKWTSFAEQNLYKDKIIFSKTTKYQHIVTTKDRSGNISLYINGNLQFNSFDEHIYHENLVHPAFSIAKRRKNILILGGGDGLALREVLKYKEVESVTLCDIDPEMTIISASIPEISKLNKGSLENTKLVILRNNALKPALSEKILQKKQNGRYNKKPEELATVNIINMDASKFVEQISGSYDIIIIDFPDPNNIELSKLYSRKFYLSLFKKLNAEGIIVQQSTSPIYSKEAFLTIGRTMEASGFSPLPYHDNIPSFGEWGFFIAGKNKYFSKQKIKGMLENVDKIYVDTRYLTKTLIKSSLTFGKEQLITDKNDINTIINNVIHEYYISGWEQFN